MNENVVERYKGQLYVPSADKHRVAMQRRPPLIYVSGPLTTGQLTVNVHEAIKVGKALIDRGYAVVVPHEKFLTEVLQPESYNYWMEYDFKIILCCDGVYRMPGASRGGDAEVAFAMECGIPVYFSFDTLFAEQRVPGWLPVSDRLLSS